MRAGGLLRTHSLRSSQCALGQLLLPSSSGSRQAARPQLLDGSSRPGWRPGSSSSAACSSRAGLQGGSSHGRSACHAAAPAVEPVAAAAAQEVGAATARVLMCSVHGLPVLPATRQLALVPASAQGCQRMWTPDTCHKLTMPPARPAPARTLTTNHTNTTLSTLLLNSMRR